MAKKYKDGKVVAINTAASRARDKRRKKEKRKQEKLKSIGRSRDVTVTRNGEVQKLESVNGELATPGAAKALRIKNKQEASQVNQSKLNYTPNLSSNKNQSDLNYTPDPSRNKVDPKQIAKVKKTLGFIESVRSNISTVRNAVPQEYKNQRQNEFKDKLDSFRKRDKAYVRDAQKAQQDVVKWTGGKPFEDRGVVSTFLTEKAIFLRNPPLAGQALANAAEKFELSLQASTFNPIGVASESSRAAKQAVPNIDPRTKQGKVALLDAALGAGLGAVTGRATKVKPTPTNLKAPKSPTVKQKIKATIRKAQGKDPKQKTIPEQFKQSGKPKGRAKPKKETPQIIIDLDEFKPGRPLNKGEFGIGVKEKTAVIDDTPIKGPKDAKSRALIEAAKSKAEANKAAKFRRIKQERLNKLEQKFKKGKINEAQYFERQAAIEQGRKGTLQVIYKDNKIVRDYFQERAVKAANSNKRLQKRKSLFKDKSGSFRPKRKNSKLKLVDEPQTKAPKAPKTPKAPRAPISSRIRLPRTVRGISYGASITTGVATSASIASSIAGTKIDRVIDPKIDTGQKIKPTNDIISQGVGQGTGTTVAQGVGLVIATGIGSRYGSSSRQTTSSLFRTPPTPKLDEPFKKEPGRRKTGRDAEIGGSLRNGNGYSSRGGKRVTQYAPDLQSIVTGKKGDKTNLFSKLGLGPRPIRNRRKRR